MQNIAKTDINSTERTSQQECRQERPLQAATNRWQTCLNAETEEQQETKIDDKIDIRAKTTFSCSNKTKETTRNSRGTTQEITVDYHRKYYHRFNFDRIETVDFLQLYITLANHLNITKQTIRRINTEYFLDDTDRNRQQTNGKSEKSTGCTFVANSTVRSVQHAVFQPIFLQTLQAIGKCKHLQERLSEERRLC